MAETLQYDDEKREFSSPSGKDSSSVFISRNGGAHVVIKWYICGNFVDGWGQDAPSLYKSES